MTNFLYSWNYICPLPMSALTKLNSSFCHRKMLWYNSKHLYKWNHNCPFLSIYPFTCLVNFSYFIYATCCNFLSSQSLQCLYLACSHLLPLTQMEYFYSVYFISLNDSQCFHDLCVDFPDEVFHNRNKLNEWHTVCRHLFALWLVTEKQLVLEKQNMEFWITAILPS